MAEGENEEVRRILSIDGGGLKGAFPASVLASLESAIGRPIGDYFDLVAGTSTGGIIAIGLGLGIPASKILELYQSKGPKIFGQDGSEYKNWLARKAAAIRHWSRPKHQLEDLKSALEEVLGDHKLGHSKTRLLVPAWNADERSVFVQKTSHHPRFEYDYKTTAVSAALATAAAPTYFRQHITADGVGLIDGGVWANNPTGAAVVEAIAVLGWPAKKIRVLSLGCTDEIFSVPKNGGILSFNLKLMSLFMAGQSHSSMGTAKLLTGDEHDRQAIIRIDHSVEYGKYKLDDTQIVEELIGLGHTKARYNLPKIRKMFFNEVAKPFIPIHPLSEHPTDETRQ